MWLGPGGGTGRWYAMYGRHEIDNFNLVFLQLF